MLDFPASPTVGQQFTAAGVTWVWDGTKWAASGLSGGPFLPLAGGTLTGDLTINESSITRLWLNSPTNGFGNFVYGQKGGLNRWFAALGDGTAESGGNAGSNFYLGCAADNGTGLWTPISINRASGQVTIPNLSAPQAIGDNRIINGDMRIDQRNNGSSGTAATSLPYTVDRWFYYGSQASKGTWGRNLNGQGGPAASFGFPYCLGFQSSSAYASVAADQFIFCQPIEADTVSDFMWGTSGAQPATLSFFVFSSLIGTFSGCVQNYAGTRSYPFSYSIPAAGWYKIAITIPGDVAGTWVMSGNGGAVNVVFDLGSGSSHRGPANTWASAAYNGVTGSVSVVAVNGATFYVTGVKLEIGSVATPFNRQSLAKSQADCQRYFIVLGTLAGAGYSTSATVVQHCLTLPVTMRAVPTATPTWGTNTNLSPSVGALQTASFAVSGSSTATGQWGWNLTSCQFSAEL